MTIAELYTQLSDKGFQDHQTGSLVFPAYMYAYNAEKEYEIDAEIRDIQNRLHRPNNYLDVLVLDIFEEFVAYLKSTTLGRQSRFDYYLNYELKNPNAIDKGLKIDAYHESFFNALEKKINDHLSAADSYEVAYVFVKGFGNAYPYIRASRFMNKFESKIKGYKLIMFYPGEVKDYYSLFGLLKDENLYRAIKLINE